MNARREMESIASQLSIMSAFLLSLGLFGSLLVARNN
jgi:hypothetical protein